MGRAHQEREVAARRVRLADDDVPGAGVASDRGGHEPDRAGSDDEDILAEDREAERGVDRVSEGVADRGDVLVNPGPVLPHVRDRQDGPPGERSIAVPPEPDCPCAEVPPPRPAMSAVPTHDVALTADA